MQIRWSNDANLVLGASGMLGHAVVRVLANGNKAFHVIAASRTLDVRARFPRLEKVESITGVDVENTDVILDLFARTRPDWVINCVGLVKQRSGSDDPLIALPINAMLPHRLAHLCTLEGQGWFTSVQIVFFAAHGEIILRMMPPTQLIFMGSLNLSVRYEALMPLLYALRSSVMSCVARRDWSSSFLLGKGQCTVTRMPSSRACQQSRSLG